MIQTSQQVFEGGWKQLVHAKFKAMGDLIMGSPVSVNWKIDDGSKVFVAEGGSDTLKEFTAVTPWGAAGLLETAASPSFGAIENNVRTADIADDGSRFWLSGLTTAIGVVTQLDFGVKWDVSTLDVTTPSGTFNPPNSSGLISGLKVIDKRRKLFLLVADTVYDYTFNTPGDISAGLVTGTSEDISASAGGSDDMTEIELSTDGRFLYALSRNPYKVFRYRLNTRNTLADGITLLDDVILTDGQLAAFGLFIRPTNGKQLYTVGFDDDDIAEYDMSLLENNTLITPFGEELVTPAGEVLVVP